MSDYVWVRVKAACRDCAVVIDMPAFVPMDSKPTATLVHAAAKHYVDLETSERPASVSADRAPNRGDLGDIRTAFSLPRTNVRVNVIAGSRLIDQRGLR